MLLSPEHPESRTRHKAWAQTATPSKWDPYWLQVTKCKLMVLNYKANKNPAYRIGIS